MSAAAASVLDAQARGILRALRQSARRNEYTRWEALRNELLVLGYRVVVVRGRETLRPLGE